MCIFQLATVIQRSNSSNAACPRSMRSNLRRISSSLIMATPIVKRVDAWELRCRFNRARYVQMVQRGELIAKLDRTNPSRSGPPNTFHQQWYYIHPVSGDQMARVSQFVYADGTIARPPDPKFLFLHGIHYHLHTGPPENKSPELRLPGQWLRAIYKFWRKRIKCPLLGR